MAGSRPSSSTTAATAIFFAWPAHWWLEHFDGLRRYLEERYGRLHDDELLIAFDLRG